jgi:glutathione synthase/RimK-type ligase-like ATP-grasp enzyme
MKRILVIGSKRADASKIEPLSDIAAYLQRTIDVDSNDIAVQHCQLDELVHVLDGPTTTISVAETGEALESYDFVWFRGKLAPSLNELGIVTQYLQRKQVPFANHSYADRAPFGKLAQMYLLSTLNLSYPKTVSTIADHMPAAVAREFSYPIILKAIHAGHGHSNYLVRDEPHLRELLAAEPDTIFVAQTYIPNEGDYRLLIVGDQELIILRKGSEDSHLNNTSQGGAATLVSPADFPANILADARKFAQACNYAIAGVDVMFGSQDGQPYFLEANSQPQLMSGAFTDEKAVLVKNFFLANLG